MRAAVYDKPGPPEVLRIAEVDPPVPRDGELLIRVHASTVTSGDCHLRGFRFPFLFWFLLGRQHGIKRPKIPVPGSELAGVVDAVGNKVQTFNVGDPVFGSTGMRFGANAEFVCLPEDGVVATKPTNLTHAEAAAVPFGALSALFFLRKGHIQSGQQVLVYGASGAVGSYAVQLARHFGAEVTGVCSTPNLEWVSALGAARVIDYTREALAASGARYDLVLDAVGKASAADCRRALAPGGAYVTVSRGLARDRQDDLLFLKGLLEAGNLRPVIDRRYPLDRIAEAHRYVERGHKRGAVVITVDDGEGIV